MTAPCGYSIVLPPGWARIPAREDSDRTISRILDASFAELPKEIPPDRTGPLRKELERRLRDMVTQARDHSALDLFLPVQPVHGTTIAASFVVSEAAFDGGQPEPAQIAARLISTADDAQAAEVDGALAVRTARVVPGEHPSRRVDYTVAVPDDPDRWLLLSFSTLGGGDPRDEVADLLVELFDAMVTTFRWSHP
jgi:hypothetical protein